MLEALRAAGLYDDALVVVTSDHGEAFMEHGWIGHNTTLYSEMLRVPLLLKLPRDYRSGLTIKEPVSLIDLAPTILDGVELAGLVDGTTFVGNSLLKGQAPSPVFASREHPIAGELYALRNDRHLYLRGSAVYHAAPSSQLG